MFVQFGRFTRLLRKQWFARLPLKFHRWWRECVQCSRYQERRRRIACNIAIAAVRYAPSSAEKFHLETLSQVLLSTLRSTLMGSGTGSCWAYLKRNLLDYEIFYWFLYFPLFFTVFLRKFYISSMYLLLVLQFIRLYFPFFGCSHISARVPCNGAHNINLFLALKWRL